MATSKYAVNNYELGEFISKLTEVSETNKTKRVRRKVFNPELNALVKEAIDYYLQSDDYNNNGLVKFYPLDIAETAYKDNWNEICKNAGDKNSIKEQVIKSAMTYAESKGVKCIKPEKTPPGTRTVLTLEKPAKASTPKKTKTPNQE